MSVTWARRRIDASPARVYRALLDPAAIARWKVPDGMTCEVHDFDARVGGCLRVSLTYIDQRGAGKTSSHTDTYRGRFVELVPDQRVVEVDEFETDDASLRGEMTITYTLREVGGSTELVAEHRGLPRGVSTTDNEAGWREALGRLADLLESGPSSPRQYP